MTKKPVLIIVNGFPATGKGSISRKIAEQFKLPLICVDELKEIIFNRTKNWKDANFFDRISKSSYDLMYHISDRILYSGNSCILEAFFRAEMAEIRLKELVSKYKCSFLQIHLKANGKIICKRYQDRQKQGERHPCHPGRVAFEEFLTSGGENKKVKVKGKYLSVDTSDFRAVDLDSIFCKIRKLL